MAAAGDIFSVQSTQVPDCMLGEWRFLPETLYLWAYSFYKTFFSAANRLDTQNRLNAKIFQNGQKIIYKKFDIYIQVKAF
jgi:hypothetical protein